MDKNLNSLVMHAQHRRDRMFVQLVSDLLRFELDVMEGRSELFPEMRPNFQTVQKRYVSGLKAIQPALLRLGMRLEVNTGDTITAIRNVCALVEQDTSAAEKRMLQLSILPVYTVHDEYMFLRILQSFEVTFAWTAVHFRAALAAFENSPDEVVRQINLGEAMLQEAFRLFALLNTMQKESFRTFRTYTEGASAIQSRNYKTVESLCRMPDESRLNSIAYQSVPEVREKLFSGHRSLDEAFISVCESGHFTPAKREAIKKAMQRFAITLQRWKRTHYGIAVKMLGEGTGTGYTEGTPYLKEVRNIPIFKSFDENANLNTETSRTEEENIE